MPEAIAFVVECLEAGSPAHLFDQTLEAEGMTDPQRYAQRAKQFAQQEYLELLREHTRLDLRERYRAEAFPKIGHQYTGSGERAAGETAQFEFRKRDNAWVIERIWVRR